LAARALFIKRMGFLEKAYPFFRQPSSFSWFWTVFFPVPSLLTFSFLPLPLTPSPFLRVKCRAPLFVRSIDAFSPCRVLFRGLSSNILSPASPLSLPLNLGCSLSKVPWNGCLPFKDPWPVFSTTYVVVFVWDLIPNSSPTGSPQLSYFYPRGFFTCFWPVVSPKPLIYCPHSPRLC